MAANAPPEVPKKITYAHTHTNTFFDRTKNKSHIHIHTHTHTHTLKTQGHPDAWYNLGTIYFEGGKGVKKDEEKALECFHHAASLPEEKSGSPAYWLGYLYSVRSHTFTHTHTRALCV